jgi:hypothetical protein
MPPRRSSRSRTRPTPRFTFTRIRYGGPSFGRGGSRWNHDYPRADRHLSTILAELTSTAVQLHGTNVLTLEDSEIFRNPILYISEPGFWTLTEHGVRNLADHLRKGGFLIFDDFENDEIRNVYTQMQRVLPGCQFIEIGPDHPIFDTFFKVNDIYFPHPLVPVTPRYFAVFEDNDPARRMLAIVNHNNDLAEYWEWSNTKMFSEESTSDAYKLGANYIIYGMTR